MSGLSGGEPRGDGVSPKEVRRAGQRVSPDLTDDTDSDLDFDIGKLEQQSRAAREVPGKSVERDGVEDKFFRLADMEKFLEKMEEAHGKEEDDEDDEDDIDLFEDLDSDEDEGMLGGRNQKPGKSSRNLKYKDFFDPVDSDDGTAGTPGAEQGSDAEEERSKEDDGEERISELDEDENLEDADDARPRRASAKRVTFALPDDEEEEEQEEEEMEEMGDMDDTSIFKDKKDATEVKSSFEKRQEKMREKIASLEKELLEKKSWQLQGEVTAQKRPENSLLEENLHFDHAVRLAPVITEDTTLRLEDLIKQRIRDQAWDDVVRKEKPKEEAFEYKKRLTLDHEKSKLSLAEVYEQEYLKLSQEKAAEEENPVHVEIQKLMDSLFLKLDALSNFHFIPKPPVPEIKVVSNLPAITMEEVAPVGVSDAALLAPEEVKGKNKAGDVKAAAEKTLTDRKRERRKRKLQKRLRLQEKEKRRRALEKSHPEQAGKVTKAAAAQKLQQLTKTGRAALLKDEGKGKALKSSQAFFSHLQDQVKMEIGDAKKTEKKKKKKEQALSVHELKL